MRIGLALGGGGITGGAFHAGVLSALVSTTGWDARSAELIIGTSVGAITATSLRVGMPPMDLLHRQLGQPLSPEGTAILSRVPPGSRDLAPTGQRNLRPASPDLLKAFARSPGNAHLGGFAAAALPEGRVSTSTIEHNMAALCANEWPAGQLWLTAMRLSDGERVAFGREEAQARPPIGSAVAASCAIPGYFVPVKIAGDRYVDGGMASVCNADLLLDQNLDVALISAPMAIHSGLRVAADTPIRRILRRQVDQEVEALRASGVEVFLFAPVDQDVAAMGANPMAAGREAQVARSVHAHAEQRLSANQRLLDLLRAAATSR